jgi:hypothetical protein
MGISADLVQVRVTDATYTHVNPYLARSRRRHGEISGPKWILVHRTGLLQDHRFHNHTSKLAIETSEV